MTYMLGFVMEQTLGQVTHDQNFRRRVAEDEEVRPSWMPIAFDTPDRWSRVPFVRSNWTMRASLRARARVHSELRSRALDGLFFHTLVTAALCHDVMERIPSVVSMDATPLNLDTVGASYGHAPSRWRCVEGLKNVVARRTFHHAAAIIVWCEWARESLIHEYHVAPSKITVIPPGVDLRQWGLRRDGSRPSRCRLLFVGGDFHRKGGDLLLQVLTHELQGRCELDIVTRDAIASSPFDGVRVHRDLQSNTPALRALFAQADIFVLPTRGDCLPLVLMEAMAAGLPIIATDVGAIREEVQHGVTGLLVPRDDPHALASAIDEMSRDPDMRRAMGAAGRRAAEQLFDARRNYHRILRVCKHSVDGYRCRVACAS